MINQIFVNLPVTDLSKSIKFYESLGFAFNPEFTDEKAACLILGENIYAMLLTKPFFKSFIDKEITDTTHSIEVINAISLESRAAVDVLTQKALSAGGLEIRPSQDYGWMYSRSFTDPDGHVWEPFFADEAARNKALQPA